MQGLGDLFRGVLAAGLVLAMASTASAAMVSADEDAPEGCFSTDPDDCVGGLYTLNVNSNGGDSYTAFITMDFSGVYDLDLGGNSDPTISLTHLEIKVAPTYENVSFVGGDALAGPLNNGGCGGGNGGFLCIELVNPIEIVTDSLSFEITFDAPDGLLEDGKHLGARYEWTNPNSGRLQSALLSMPIPEPTSALLFGLGLIVTGQAVRRRV